MPCSCNSTLNTSWALFLALLAFPSTFQPCYTPSSSPRAQCWPKVAQHTHYLGNCFLHTQSSIASSPTMGQSQTRALWPDFSFLGESRSRVGLCSPIFPAIPTPLLCFGPVVLGWPQLIQIHVFIVLAPTALL